MDTLLFDTNLFSDQDSEELHTCCTSLKRMNSNSSTEHVYSRKEKRCCDCPTLDCRHCFHFKSDSLVLMTTYYKSDNSETHPIFSLGTDIFEQIMDYARYGEKIDKNSTNNQSGIIEYISKQNYKKEFINPYTLGIIQVNDVHFSKDYELQNDITELFDMNNCDNNEYDIDYVDNHESSSIMNTTVQSISSDEFIITYPHHALCPTHYTIQNGGGNFAALNSWVLEGHIEGNSDWILLDEHIKDNVFTEDIKQFSDTHTEHSWTIQNTNNHYFTSFRLRNTSINPNTHKPYPMYIYRIEFYGYVETFKIVSNSIVQKYLEE